MFFSKNTKPSTGINGRELGADELIDLLRPINDPDLGFSIVDLGLIYKVENNDGKISVDMTFTTPACPYGPQLMEEVRYTLTSLDGIDNVDIEVVWEPAWSLEKISEATRLEMGLDI